MRLQSSAVVGDSTATRYRFVDVGSVPCDESRTRKWQKLQGHCANRAVPCKSGTLLCVVGEQSRPGGVRARRSPGVAIFAYTLSLTEKSSVMRTFSFGISNCLTGRLEWLGAAQSAIQPVQTAELELSIRHNGAHLVFRALRSPLHNRETWQMRSYLACFS